MERLALIFVLVSGLAAHAGTVRLKTLGANDYEKIRIVLSSGRVVLNSVPEKSASATDIVISAEEQNPFWSTQSQGNVLEVRYTPTGTAPASGEIALSGRSLPVEIYLREGTLTAKKWGETTAVIQKGTLQGLETHGNWKVHVLEGEIDFGGHQGDLVVEGFEPKVQIRTMKGDLTAHLHSGSLNVESLQGQGSWTLHRTKVTVKGGQGDLRFDSKLGPISIVGFQGGIEGASESGPLTLKAFEAVDIKIQTREAPIDVWIPAKSAASVNLESQTGRVLAPKYLKAATWSAGSVFRGSLKGEIPGRLSLRSQSGRVSLKID